jgi:bifunctional lysine-specific demethylase and histidyl-hydroxylase NO66
MGAVIATFADLLAPIEPGVFFEQSWEKEPLHITRSASTYEGLLTNNDVEAVISSGGLRYPAIQLAKAGGFYPPEAFTRSIRSGGDIFTGIPTLEHIRAEYQGGATISLPGFHRAWKPLGTLAGAVEDEFDHPVHTNVYITPGNAAGFTPHYDTHEIFVLQIAGKKRWRIEKPPLRLPHRSQPFNPQSYVGSAPLLEVDLSPGDLLYLPRGFVHSTTTSDSFSIHVTLGMTVYTWVELLAEFAQSSRDIPSLRRALLPGFAGRKDIRKTLQDQLPRVIAELQRLTDFEGLMEDFSRRLRSTRGEVSNDFRFD